MKTQHATHDAPTRLEELTARLSTVDAERAALLAEIEALQPERAKTLDMPANHGKPWTSEEKAAVADLFMQDMAIKDIAREHGRSAGGIRAELIRQGLIEREEPATVTEPAPVEKKREAPKPESKIAPTITPEFQEAFELLENTHTNVFLTGKAGTGKSTFLKYFRENTCKKMAVVAPTGVAALNVGAQTIHSFFRLKPAFVDVKALKPTRSKVLKELELLIIDEISMVRADIFEGIDHSLKLARKNNKPFGGVQVCVIGDLFQLPPVVTREEKEFFTQYYQTPFFFGTKSYASANFKTIQFNTIHRQNDGAFIQILNAIRAGTCDVIELEALNSRLNPKASPAPGTLVLTTTNALAEDINSGKLAGLAGKPRSYAGSLSGDFGMKGGRLPAPEELILKVGAQVMFVKNDSEGRWVNGTIGLVEKLGNEVISIKVGDVLHEVEPEKWKTIGYEFSEEKGEIAEKTLGTYTQFPLTLAWAITIHKSQGKTLERVIIDLGSGAFAAGQLYVALSRCKSLSGIALKQPITPADIRCDGEVVEFMRHME
ncbi:MAG: AAA family ATPase [Rickettsiales bacterium]|nr:AAA family ATPase [Rickettsiales bacterium]